MFASERSRFNRVGQDFSQPMHGLIPFYRQTVRLELLGDCIDTNRDLCDGGGEVDWTEGGFTVRWSIKQRRTHPPETVDVLCFHGRLDTASGR
jgi:hypothetical protein